MPPSPGSSSAEGTGARPSPLLRGCSSRSQSRFPAWGTMVRWAGRPGLPIFISGRIARLGEREPPSQCERATTKVRAAKEGGSQCQRSGRRGIWRQASLARQAKRSQRRRPRAGSNRGRSRPAARRKVGPVIYRASGLFRILDVCHDVLQLHAREDLGEAGLRARRGWYASVDASRSVVIGWSRLGPAGF
jgi:hypothetical protein